MVAANKCISVLLLCTCLSVLGCTATGHTDEAIPAEVDVTFEEFIDGMAKPILELMKGIGYFYNKNATPPPSLVTLRDFAKTNNTPFNTQNITGWQVSDMPQETEVIFQILTPSSQAASGKITTSWRLRINKSAPDRITINSLSYFCVLNPKPDSMSNIVSRFAMAVLAVKLHAHELMPYAPSNKWCSAPLPGDPKARQKQEQMMERMRQKMKLRPRTIEEQQ